MTPATTAVISGRINPATSTLLNTVKMSKLVFALALVCTLTVAVSPSAAAQTFTNLHSFGSGSDGTTPQSTLVKDSSGNLYGTTETGGTNGYGTVFQLTPPAISGGVWTEAVIFNFDDHRSGSDPFGNLAIDKNGNLYGTTVVGGGSHNCFLGCGTAFQLKPPTTIGGTWTYRTMHNFVGLTTDGSNPEGGVTVNDKGVLFGTTVYNGVNSSSFGGVVFQIQPTGSGFTETILHDFGASGDGFKPDNTLLLDKLGNLYGTTTAGGTGGGSFGGGTVFRLSPPVNIGDPWTETILYSFPGTGTAGYYPTLGTLVFDASGNLYGTTSEGGVANVGTVFRLSPPVVGGTTWTNTTLYELDAITSAFPSGGVTLDPKTQILYATTYATTYRNFSYRGCGILFALTPPAVAGGKWGFNISHSFAPNFDGCSPVSQLLRDSANHYYGVAFEGGGTNNGTVFEFTP